jgi:hypothetical protein
MSERNASALTLSLSKGERPARSAGSRQGFDKLSPSAMEHFK